MKHLRKIMTACVGLFCLVFSVVHAHADSPKIIKGKNLSISGFRVDEASLKPYIMRGYEAVPDGNGNYTLLMGAGEFDDTYGIDPYQVLALFVEVKEKGAEKDSLQFMPIWGANSTKEAVSVYQNVMGLPFNHPSKMSVVFHENGKQKVSVKVKNGSSKVSVKMEVQKLDDDEKTDFSELALVGKLGGEVKLTQEVIGFRFTDSKLEKLEVKADKDSPLSLISKDNHVFTTASNSHAAVLYP